MFFTSAGAAQGEVVLAVNTLLMQLFTLFSYVMDGFAYAGEALAGRYIGAKNQTGLRSTVHHLFYWGLGLSFLFTLLYSVGGKSFLGLLTNSISRFFRLSLGWYLYRRYRHPPNALLHVGSFRQLFRNILRIPFLVGKSCLMVGFPCLSFTKRNRANLFRETNHAKSNRSLMRSIR